MKEDKALAVISTGPVNPGTVNAEVLISKALETGVSVDVMERLLTIRRELKAEAAKSAFDQALANFQSQCPAIKKNRQVMNKDGRSVRYSYAPLEVIVHQVKDLLKANGFSYTLDAKVEAGWVEATCKATHEMGHSELSRFKVPIDNDAFMNEAQKFASALTFTKRYAFCNAFGILTGDEDDDSIASGTEPKAEAVVTPKPRQEPKEATEKTREWFIKEIGADRQAATQYLIDWGWLMPNESLEQLSLCHVPVTRKQLAQFKAGMNAFMSTGNLVDPYETVIDVPQNVPQKKDEPWRSFPVPYGKHAGVKLGELEKPTLFGFWANFDPNEEYKGKPRTEGEMTRRLTFRKMLDDAGKHYGFTLPEDKE